MSKQQQHTEYVYVFTTTITSFNADNRDLTVNYYYVLRIIQTVMIIVLQFNLIAK